MEKLFDDGSSGAVIQVRGFCSRGSQRWCRAAEHPQGQQSHELGQHCEVSSALQLGELCVALPLASLIYTELAGGND